MQKIGSVQCTSVTQHTHVVILDYSTTIPRKEVGYLYLYIFELVHIPSVECVDAGGPELL